MAIELSITIYYIWWNSGDKNALIYKHLLQLVWYKSLSIKYYYCQCYYYYCFYFHHYFVHYYSYYRVGEERRKDMVGIF